MSIRQRLAQWIAGRPRRAYNLTRRAPEAAPESEGEDYTLRRWEGSETNRLNQAHWQKAHGRPINEDLNQSLEALRSRCQYEAANNAIVAGAIATYAMDVSGPGGPILQVTSSNEQYNEALECVFWDWWTAPDASGVMGGVDFLRLWVGQFWTSGELLTQIVVDPEAVGVAVRMRAIDPSRLATPTTMSADVVMGVRRTKFGRPIEYYVKEQTQVGAYSIMSGAYSTVPAADMIHEFVVQEADQARGVPWLAPSLPAIADLRDYDKAVLQAARHAAEASIYWYTDHPDAEFLEVNETTTIELGQEVTGPPGWKPMQLAPTQPGNNYQSFRTERLRELGRPVNMPLMMVKLGSEESNYSSARFDSEIYKRGIFALRDRLERRILNRLLETVRREAELYAAANPGWKYAAVARPPDDVVYRWIWPALPNVDPEKAAQAVDVQLKNGTVTYSEALAEAGKDVEAVIAQRQQDNERLKAAGLPPVGQLPPANVPPSGQGNLKSPPDEGDDAAEPVK